MQDKKLIDGTESEINKDSSNKVQDDKIGEAEKDALAVPLKKLKKRGSLQDLQFVRIFDPIHIPSYLIEQIKDRNFKSQDFYCYQRLVCLQHTSEGSKLNPTNLLYVLINGKLKQVKGFLWMCIDLLTNSLVVNNFSIDKEYWNKGEATLLLEEKAKKVMKDLSLKRIIWVTRNSKFCEAQGFKKTKHQVMYYEE